MNEKRTLANALEALYTLDGLFKIFISRNSSLDHEHADAKQRMNRLGESFRQLDSVLKTADQDRLAEKLHAACENDIPVLAALLEKLDTEKIIDPVRYVLARGSMVLLEMYLIDQETTIINRSILRLMGSSLCEKYCPQFLV